MTSQLVHENSTELLTKTLPHMFLEWKIPDNLLLSKDTENRIYSKSIHFQGTAWSLQVIVEDARSSSSSEETGAIKLLLSSCNPVILDNYVFGVKKTNGKIHRMYSEYYERRLSPCVCSDPLLWRKELIDNELNLSENGIITFFCNFSTVIPKVDFNTNWRNTPSFGKFNFQTFMIGLSSSML